MINVVKERISNIPVLHVAKQTESLNKLPLVIFMHGFTSIKEKNLHYAYFLAEKGFRVVLPEALYHGERSENATGKDLSFQFWDIVLNTIEEIKTVKEYYEAKGIIDPSRIGLSGTSMGGIITLGALTQYNWINTAVVLMGNPSYEAFAKWQLEGLQKHGIDFQISQSELDSLFERLRPYDLSVQPEKLNNRPILFWHGKKDPVVPFSHAFQFYEKIHPVYMNVKDNLQFITDEKAGHEVSREGVAKTVSWFEKHL